MSDVWQYDIAQQKDGQIRQFSGTPGKMISQFGFSAAGKLLILPLDLPGAAKIPAGQYTLSPDGALLAIHTLDNRILLWDIANQKAIPNVNIPATPSIKRRGVYQK